MVQLTVGYKTGTGNKMPITVYGVLLQRELYVPVVENPGDYCNNDKVSCGGFNGGCPPYAPHFSRLKPKLKYFYVIIVHFDMAASLMYSGWRKGISAPGMFLLMYADRLTMNYIQRGLTYFENQGHYTLGASNCPGCRPADCTVVKHQKCSKPHKRRFSLEATGVDCAELHYQLFDEELPWWYHTKEHIPCDMYRYAGVVTNEKVDVLDDLLTRFVYTDKSYIEDFEWDGGPYYVDKLMVPEGKYYEGTEYYAYRIPLEEMLNAQKG